MGRNAASAPSAAPRRAQWLVLALVALAAAGADQAAKAAVRAGLPLGEAAEAIGPLHLHHTRNSGLVHGLLPGTALPLAIATGLVLVGMLAVFARTAGTRPAFPLAFGLLVGGGASNLADRARLGYVTDFLVRGSGGAFNLADVWILAGVVAVAVSLLARERLPAAAESPSAGR